MGTEAEIEGHRDWEDGWIEDSIIIGRPIAYIPTYGTDRGP